MKYRLVERHKNYDRYEITDSNGNTYYECYKKGEKPKEKKKVTRKVQPVEYGSNRFKWGHDLFRREY